MSQTKRELREQRRAAREAAERAAAAASTRRRRLWRLAAAAGLAAIVVAVVAAVSSSDEAKQPVRASALLKGIPEKDGVLGDPSAPVTVTEYLDPQCPVCARAAANTLPALIEDYVRTGKAKLQARALHFLGPDSVRAARFAAGAERQRRLWPFLEAFYSAQGTENSGYVTDDFLRDVAAAAGVDADAAFEYADSDDAQAALDRANADAQAAGVDSTPTFTVKRGDGAEKVISVGPADLSAALDEELAR